MVGKLQYVERRFNEGFEYLIEDIVFVSPGRSLWQFELISRLSYLFYDYEGSVTKMIKFICRLLGLNVCPLKPY